MTRKSLREFLKNWFQESPALPEHPEQARFRRARDQVGQAQ